MSVGFSSNWESLKNDKEYIESSKKAVKAVKKHKPKTRIKGGKANDSKITKASSIAKHKKAEKPSANVDFEYLFQRKTTVDVETLAGELADLKKKCGTSLPLQDASKKDGRSGSYVSMDCEFVGVGPEGLVSELGRVSIVNLYGHVLLDTFVKPATRVTDWRTAVSGITSHHMKNAVTFAEAQKLTSDILKDKILVGHAVHNDLEVLRLSHPKSKIRDTSKFGPFKAFSGGRTPRLKLLAQKVLHLSIQDGEHSSVVDAQATMLLFRLTMHDPKWKWAN